MTDQTQPLVENHALLEPEMLNHQLYIQSLQDEIKSDHEKLKAVNEELEESLLGAVNLLTQLMNQRVPNASLRAQHSSEMARWMAARLGLGGETLKALELASRLRELGKITLSDDLLNKDWRTLTPDEESRVNLYPVLGQLILAGIPRLSKAGGFIRHQLENYNGSGYPDHLAGDDIPLPARILRICTVVERICDRCSDRQMILEALEKAKGVEIDPGIAQLAIEFVRKAANPGWKEGKRQIAVYELQENMVLAEDLCTSSGLKLLAKDSPLSLNAVSRILAHHQVDPILQAIYVYE